MFREEELVLVLVLVLSLVGGTIPVCSQQLQSLKQAALIT